jgi:hypothetical protein
MTSDIAQGPSPWNRLRGYLQIMAGCLVLGLMAFAACWLYLETVLAQLNTKGLPKEPTALRHRLWMFSERPIRFDELPAEHQPAWFQPAHHTFVEYRRLGLTAYVVIEDGKVLTVLGTND